MSDQSKTTIDDHDFAQIAQLIQRTTGCGGLTSNILTKKICLMLGVKAGERGPLELAKWETAYVL